VLWLMALARLRGTVVVIILIAAFVMESHRGSEPDAGSEDAGATLSAAENAADRRDSEEDG